MYKKLIESKFYFIIFFLLFSFSFRDSLAADSTSVSGVTSVNFNTSSGQKSFILYKSGPISIADQTGIPYKSYSVNSSCPTGMTACISVQLEFINDLNPSQCYLNQVGTTGVISKKTGSGYDVYIYVAAATTKKPLQTGCDDRGGTYTYMITCLPTNSVAKEALYPNKFHAAGGLPSSSGSTIAVFTTRNICVTQ